MSSHDIKNYDFESMKKRYNEFYSLKDFKKFPVAEKSFIKSLIKKYNIKPGSKVLDIGCGTGKYSSLFNKFGMYQLGIDLSDVAIDKARKLFPECNFQVGNVLELNLNDKYDVIYVSGLSLFNTSDLNTLKSFLDSLLIFLKKDGIIIFVKTSSLTNMPSKRKSRIDYTIKSFEDFFVESPKLSLLESSGTYPHSFIFFRTFAFNILITTLSRCITYLTKIPVRVTIVLRKL